MSSALLVGFGREKDFFVGREKELGELNQSLLDALEGHGAVVFVEGEAGVGKSMLISQFKEISPKAKKIKQAQFAYGYCYEAMGEQNAYQPFVEVLAGLLESNKTASILGTLVLSVLRETGKDWLNMIPGVGPVASVGVKTVVAAKNWFEERDSKSQADSLNSQYVQSISKIATKDRPLVVVIEDAHWIDTQSCNLLMRLANKITSLPVLIIVTYRSSYLNEDHPFNKIKNQLLGKSIISVISIPGLNSEEIQRYLTFRFGTNFHSNLAEWLESICKGLPLFVTQYIDLLVRDGVIERTASGEYRFNGAIRNVMGRWELSGCLASTEIPESIEALLTERIERIVEEDRKMLEIGSVQGEHFFSMVLSGLLQQDEKTVLRRMRKVIEQHHIINIYLDADRASPKSEIYVFEHIMIQQMLYKKLGPRERILYHKDIAELLEEMVKNDNNIARKLVLEIANHFDRGDLPLKAAYYYKRVAKSLVADGAYPEATHICKRAIQIIRENEPIGQISNSILPREADNLSQEVESCDEASYLKAELVELLLIATKWHRNVHVRSELSLLALVLESEKIAERVEDFSLLARLRYSRSILIGETEGAGEFIQGLRDALEAVKKSNDSIGEFIITSQLGHQLIGQDFRSGLQLQRQAISLFEGKVFKNNAEISPKLMEQYHLMKTLLGVGEFDASHFEVAINLLEQSVNSLKQIKLTDEVPHCLNYLAQAYLGLGLFEKAEEALIEAIEIVQDNEEPHSWNGYNLALRGKLYLDWGRTEDAVAPILLGWQESQKTQIKWQTPLVRNYYVELLMNRQYQGFDLDEADRQLAITIEETHRTAYHRSAIMALSLRSIVSLMGQENERAFEYSLKAIQYLKMMGTLPALRAEEVLFNHYKVLMARGHHEAQHYLVQASQMLTRKANMINSDSYKVAFLERISLNRDIQKACAES
jgi:tetratricopeptide (TPR) repeat protein